MSVSSRHLIQFYETHITCSADCVQVAEPPSIHFSSQGKCLNAKCAQLAAGCHLIRRQAFIKIPDTRTGNAQM